MHLEIRADLLSSDRDLELLGRCLQPLGGAGHDVEIRIAVGPGATTAQINTLLSWLNAIEGAVWRIESRQGPPGLGSGLIYDLAVNVGSELVAGMLLAPRLLKLAGVLKSFRRAQPVPPDTVVTLSCDTGPDALESGRRDAGHALDARDGEHGGYGGYGEYGEYGEYVEQ